MDEVSFVRVATNHDVQTVEDIFASEIFNAEQQQEYNQFKMLFAVKTVRLPNKCTNPICNSHEFVQRDVQTGRADEAAVTFYQCASCGRLRR